MKTFYRSVWISDVHLCTRDSQADLLYTFLDSIKCDYLYIVGDLIDVWALRKKWFFPDQYMEVLHKFLKRSRKGARVYYIPGNHDEIFRQFLGYSFGQVRVVRQAVHTTADGRKLLVIHGDEFDTFVRYRKWLSLMGTWAYRYVVTVHRAVNTVRRIGGRPYWSLSLSVRRKVQAAVRHLKNFEELVSQEAHRRGMDGVICGHTHRPVIQEIQGVTYYNTGDWIDHCTALVEDETGAMRLLWWEEELERRAAHDDEASALLATVRSGRLGHQQSPRLPRAANSATRLLKLAAPPREPSTPGFMK